MSSCYLLDKTIADRWCNKAKVYAEKQIETGRERDGGRGRERKEREKERDMERER